MHVIIGRYKREDFYEEYPELEKEVMIYVLLHAKRKTAVFAVLELAKFVTEKYVSIYLKCV